MAVGIEDPGGRTASVERPHAGSVGTVDIHATVQGDDAPDLLGHLVDGLVLHLESEAHLAGELADDLPGLRSVARRDRRRESLDAALLVGEGPAGLDVGRQRKHGVRGARGVGQEEVADDEEVGGEEALEEIARHLRIAERILSEDQRHLDLLATQQARDVGAAAGHVPERRAPLLLAGIDGGVVVDRSVARQPVGTRPQVEQALHVRLLAQGEDRRGHGVGDAGEEPLVAGDPHPAVVLVEDDRLDQAPVEDLGSGGHVLGPQARLRGDLRGGPPADRSLQLRMVAEGPPREARPLQP